MTEFELGNLSLFTKIGLTCSLESLEIYTSGAIENPLSFNRLRKLNENDISNFLYFSLVTKRSKNIALQKMASFLIGHLTNIAMISLNNKIKISCDEIANEILQKYLERFLFFFQLHYVRYYPNNLSDLSIKKINLLAIESLFILQRI